MSIKNPNHPQKGSTIAVDPIRKVKDVKAIFSVLSDHPRNNLLFSMGVNSGIRPGDLLQLRVMDLENLKIGKSLTIIESKTRKANFLVINKTIWKAFRFYMDELRPDPDHLLFRSRKGESLLLTIQSVNALVKKWTCSINLKGNYGAHSLRKTWGYHQRMTFGVGFEVLAKRFNHSSPTVTMRYLGIEDKEMYNTLLNEIG